MTILPNEYVEPIRMLIRWYLNAYMHDNFSKTLLERVEDKTFESKNSEITASELYHLYLCVGDAKNNVEGCGIDYNVLESIYEWVKNEYLKSKS